MIPTRELAANSGRVMEEVETEGLLVVTKDGRPRCILLPTSDVTLMEDLRDCPYARARRALLKGQQIAETDGSAELSIDEIDAEIRASRQGRLKPGRIRA